MRRAFVDTVDSQVLQWARANGCPEFGMGDLEDSEDSEDLEDY